MLFLQHLKWLFFRSSLQSAILLYGLLHLLLAVTLKDERGSSFRYEQALNNCGCCYRQLWPWARAISVIPKISQVVISWNWKGKATFVDWGQFPTSLTWEVMLLFSCPAFAFHVYIICPCIFINIHYTHTHTHCIDNNLMKQAGLSSFLIWGGWGTEMLSTLLALSYS